MLSKNPMQISRWKKKIEGWRRKISFEKGIGLGAKVWADDDLLLAVCPDGKLLLAL
jgi:hypothetical protein